MTDTDNNAASADAKRLIRTSFKAALASLDCQTGTPYASLVTVATDLACAPIFLISELAKHTQNINQDNRVSLLFDGTSALADPLSGPRVSVTGRANKDASNHIRIRFLNRHPQAAAYADFEDFSFFSLDIEHGHFVGGFGRIHDLVRADLQIDIAGTEGLAETEREIVEHMNSDHSSAVQLYATGLLGGADGKWKMTGCDPEGCDLVNGNSGLRLVFPERVRSPDGAREMLVALAQKAREA